MFITCAHVILAYIPRPRRRGGEDPDADAPNAPSIDIMEQRGMLLADVVGYIPPELSFRTSQACGHRMMTGCSNSFERCEWSLLRGFGLNLLHLFKLAVALVILRVKLLLLRNGLG